MGLFLIARDDHLRIIFLSTDAPITLVVSEE
jgi:hypothetical protein